MKNRVNFHLTLKSEKLALETFLNGIGPLVRAKFFRDPGQLPRESIDVIADSPRSTQQHLAVGTK